MLIKKYWLMITGSVIMLTVLILCILSYIGTKKPEKAPAFLPGIYTCVAQNEFCRIDDTITIRRTQMGEDNYTVRRTTAFIRIKEGKKEPPEYQQQTWDARYIDPVWLVSTNGIDTVWYFPGKNRIEKSNFHYEKIE